MEIHKVLHFCTEWASGAIDKGILTTMFDTYFEWDYDSFEVVAKATNQWTASMSQLNPKNRVTNNAKSYL